MNVIRTRPLEAPQERAQLRQYAIANDPQYDPEDIQDAHARRLVSTIGFVRAVALPLLIAFLMIAATRHTPENAVVPNDAPGYTSADEIDYFPAQYVNQGLEVEPHIEAF